MMIRRRTRHLTTAGLRLAACLVLTWTTPGSARATEPTPITWREDYAGALEEARTTNRLLWIQFTGPWCPNCLRMERDSFPDADIIDHAQRSFVPLKLRSDVHERLALGFNLSGLPATVLVTPTREIVAVRQGYLGPEELDQVLRQGLATWRAREASARPAGSGENGAGTPRSATGRAGSGTTRTEPPLALAGYCPVSLYTERRLVRGRAENAVEHEGYLYHFASAAQKDQFARDPERYIPVNRGNCPVAQLDRDTAEPGQPRWGVIYQGRVFVCASEVARRRFLEEPERYALVDVAEQGFCPHCLGESGLLVRGDPRFAITRDGRRYWFPDSSHRAAFLEANPSATAAGSSPSTPTATETASGPAATATARR